ncbi:MAG TPA: hypothetical protein DCZ94_01175 [Lentisphaeria bacterium]|nr:MAG: hypothetical protein A2X48_11600 [Lentisphaerae bacterium GWF2_49_21]HBC85543.1 hypothetical protein [Lentisphaeria bacterium]
MTKTLKFSSGFIWFLVFSASLLFQYPASALPTVTKSSIKVGMSPRIQKNSWAYVNCTISNPDSKTYEAYIRLVDEKSFMGKRTVFSDYVTVPAGAVLNYSTEIMIEDSEEYHVEIYIEDKKVPGVDTILIKTLSEREEQFYILNDSMTESMGSVNQLEYFKKKCFQLTLSSRDVPFHWSAFKTGLAIVILKPDFDKYSARQFRAIIDYAKQGGIVIFADPESTLEAAKTPLAEILPVNPLRIRKITKLDSISSFFPGFKNWGDLFPVNFLESYPRDNSIVWFKEGQFPVFCWRKTGFGEVRCSAVSLSGDILGRTDAWEKIMIFFLNHQLKYNDTKKIMTCLDDMTGYTVPGVGVVKTVFFWYFLFLAVLTGAGLYFRKSNISFAASIILSVVVTAWVFNLISAGSANTSSMLVAAVEARYPLGEFRVTDGYYGIFSRKDTIESFNAENENTKFSAIPVSMNRFANIGIGDDPSKGIIGKNQAEPVEVLTSYGVPRMYNMNIKANTTRQVNAMISTRRKESENYALPEIAYSDKGFSMKEWQAPSEFKFDYAFLALPGKVVPLSVSGSRISYAPASGESYFRGDNIMMSVEGVIRSGFRNVKPGIALVGSGELEMKFGNAGCQSRLVNFIPVNEKCETDRIYIGPESIVITAGDTATKALIPCNEFISPFSSQNATDYKISFRLPPAFAMLDPEEIEINLVYLNDGGSIIIQPALLANGKPLAGDRKSETKYVFTKDLDKVINPYSGEGFIQMNVNLSNTVSTISEKLRANKWVMKEFSIGVKGRLRPGVAPFSY